MNYKSYIHRNYVFRVLSFFLFCFLALSISQAQSIHATFQSTLCDASMTLSSTNAGSPLTSNKVLCFELDYDTGLSTNTKTIVFTSTLPAGIQLSISEEPSLITQTCAPGDEGNTHTVLTSNTSVVTLISDINSCDVENRRFRVEVPSVANTNFAEVFSGNISFQFAILDQ